MNFTGGNTLPNIGRRINWQLALLAGGLSLAISAGYFAGAFDRDATSGTTAVSQPARAPVSAAPVAPEALSSPPLQQVALIVGSEAEAALLQSTFSTMAATYPEVAEVTEVVSVVALETAQEEADFHAMTAMANRELMTVGVGLTVVDLRDGIAAAFSPGQASASQQLHEVYIVGSEAQRQSVEGQMSAEEANYSSVFVIGDTAEGNALYNTMAGEQMATGAYELIDLRN